MRKRRVTAVVLAAGEGTRMKSSLPKVLHPLCGKPLLLVLLDALREFKAERVLLVVGHQAEQVREAVGPGVEAVLQEERLGTGHAVMAAGPSLGPGDENLLVLAGDIPLITPATLKAFYEQFSRSGAGASVLTMQLENPAGYGRVVRGPGGQVARIVEERDASAAERLITEVNSSIYLFKRPELFDCLERVGNDNRKREYYLTDVIELMLERGGQVTALQADEASEAMGINTRAQLAEAERIMRERINAGWMEKGVTVVDPRQTYIDLGVSIGQETVIHPFTFLTGATRVGRECSVGPFTRIADSTLGDRVTVTESVVRESSVEEGAAVGPYASLRPGTRISAGAKAGTFVEIKNSVVGRESKVPHLSYMGDAVIGEEVNVGAGSITCNYDGRQKHATVIEDGAFIGSDTMLIAPVRIGRGAVTGAGSAISKDVPPAALGVERSQQRNVEGYRKPRAAATKRIRKPGAGGEKKD